MDIENNMHKPLLQSSQNQRSHQLGSITCENPPDVEDEAKIVDIVLYQKSSLKIFIYNICCILTLSFLALICRWRISTRLKWKFKRSSIDQANYVQVFGHDGTSDVVQLQNEIVFLENEDEKPTKLFQYRLYKYYFDEKNQIFKPIVFDLKGKKCSAIYKEFGNGVSSFAIYAKRQQTFGFNLTQVPMKSNFKIMMDEILSPFYVFQIFSCILWWYDDYATYATMIFVISITSLAISFYTTKSNYKKLQEKTFHESRIKVRRAFQKSGSNTNAIFIDSGDLVPGDIVEVPSDEKICCDMILIQGVCIINESMLTGESVPVIKEPLLNDDSEFDYEKNRKSILFSGTECLETRLHQGKDPVLAIVIGTGFSTTKGKLIRSMIFPKPENFKFYSDAVKFIGVMAIFSFIGFIFVAHTLHENGVEPLRIILKSLDLITITVPPALPTCLTVGAEIAVKRLEKMRVACKSQNKVNVAGKVDVLVFDKTGTLTEEGLDMYGVIPLITGAIDGVRSVGFSFLKKENFHQGLNMRTPQDNSVLNDVKELPNLLLQAMTSCHSLTRVQGKLSGDPLDLKMFESVAWNIFENNEIQNPEGEATIVCPPVLEIDSSYYKEGDKIIIQKRFEFIPQLQRMSVIVKDTRELNTARVFVKGSPEIIRDLSIPETIPKDFVDVLSSYTKGGLRVLAIGTRPINSFDPNIDRLVIEKDLTFIGFIIFQNRLKPATTSAITELKEAKMRILMATGDNALTAISVARKCKIVQRNDLILLGENIQIKGEQIEINWKDIEMREMDAYRISINRASKAKEELYEDDESAQATVVKSLAQSNKLKRPKDIIEALDNTNGIVIAMTGSVFITLFEIYNQTKDPEFLRFFELLLDKSAVYARMKPEHKAFLVEAFQRKKNIVGMCGDGANDCPALKTADVGVSLSDAEASLAAPFLSKIQDISSVSIVLKEGRCALTTSFHCFKFMALYSVIQTISQTVLLGQHSAISNTQFLYMDLLIIFPMSITLSYTHAYHELADSRPTGSLVGSPVLTSILGQMVIQLFFQLFTLYCLWQEEWYKTSPELHPVVEDDYMDYIPCYDNRTTLAFSQFQYIFVCLAFAVGKPFRKPFYTNIIFTFFVIVAFVASVLTLFTEDQEIQEVLMLFDIPFDFKITILELVALNSVLTILYEKIFAANLSLWINDRIRQMRKAKKQDENKLLALKEI